jgi:hypothetical protein
MLLEELKQTCPNAWKEFLLMVDEIWASRPDTSKIPLERLPFDLAFGLFLRFFKENELEFDYNNLESSQYEEEIKSIFQNFEGVISHYS